MKRFRDIHNIALHQVNTNAREGLGNDDFQDIEGVNIKNKSEFLVAGSNKRIIGKVALKSIDKSTGEIKRIRVYLGNRRKGIGLSILDQHEKTVIMLG